MAAPMMKQTIQVEKFQRTLLRRLIDAVAPLRARRAVIALLAYCTPRSEWWSRGRREHTAFC